MVRGKWKENRPLIILLDRGGAGMVIFTSCIEAEMRTYLAKREEVKRKWFIVDADGKTSTFRSSEYR